MAGGGENSPIIDGIVKNDKVPWYRKKNLRTLYLWLVPFALFIESTSGFDSSMMNVRLFLNHVYCHSLNACTAMCSLRWQLLHPPYPWAPPASALLHLDIR